MVEILTPGTLWPCDTNEQCWGVTHYKYRELRNNITFFKELLK